jgi:hypothetical protein
VALREEATNRLQIASAHRVNCLAHPPVLLDDVLDTSSYQRIEFRSSPSNCRGLNIAQRADVWISLCEDRDSRLALGAANVIEGIS